MNDTALETVLTDAALEALPVASRAGCASLRDAVADALKARAPELPGAWIRAARRDVLIDTYRALRDRNGDWRQHLPREAAAAVGMAPPMLPGLPATGGDAGAVLAAMIAPHLPAPAPAVDREELAELVRDAVAANVYRYEVTYNGQAREIAGAQHHQFPVLLAAIAARVSAYVVGPAGSGKSYAARQAAQALGIAYEDMSVGPQTSKADILGYMSAGGEYVGTAFRRAFEHGGVFLFDEIDAAHPGVLTIINGATANGHCTFPDRQVARHADCIILAAANTYGQGANRQYVGRNQLDAATLDRFAFLAWDYDLALEAAACGVVENAKAPAKLQARAIGTAERERWLARVRKARDAAERNGLRHVISPRASIMGIALLGAGIDAAQVAEMVIYKGADRDARAKLGE